MYATSTHNLTELVRIARLYSLLGYRVQSAGLQGRVGGICGYSTLVVLVSGHHDVTIHSPVCTPAVQENTSLYNYRHKHQAVLSVCNILMYTLRLLLYNAQHLFLRSQ